MVSCFSSASGSVDSSFGTSHDKRFELWLVEGRTEGGPGNYLFPLRWQNPDKKPGNFGNERRGHLRFSQNGNTFSPKKARTDIMGGGTNQQISLDRIRIGGRVCRLARKLIVTVEHEDDRLTLSNEEFGLVVSAETLEEGIAGLSEELASLWEVYVDADPANLTADALRLRSNLTSLVPA